jgi:hypothetical protein
MEDIVKKDGRKSRGAMSVRKISLARLNSRLLTCLSRDTNHLLVASYAGKLESRDAATLGAYLKLIQELRKSEQAELANMTDEQLEKLAAK